MTELDKNGQPLNRALCARRIKDRGVDELLGICKGIIADNIVNQSEAEFLLNWLEANVHLEAEWPADVIYARVYEFLRDGVLDEDEQKELFDLLKETAGGIVILDEPQSLPTSLPFDVPSPEVFFENCTFCLTGKFAFGTRRECSDEILNLGGWVVQIPTHETDYTVIGTFCSRDWIHSSYGRKVEQAIKLKEQGFPVAIISEDRWAEYLISV